MTSKSISPKDRLIFALPADRIFALPAADLGAGLAWLGALCYTLQIYFDFSGYSDMAIGLGRMFGFRLPENFNYPYIARSAREFWRRWHISLSSWFRDYLYIPLGGNRRSPGRTYLNLLVVFFLCGLWHGASWNFVVWGLFHGFFLALERTSLAKTAAVSPRILKHAYALLVVVVGWVIFRAETLGGAASFLAAMIGLGGGGAGAKTPLEVAFCLNAELYIALAIGLAGSLPLLPALARRIEEAAGGAFEALRIGALALVLCYSAVLMAAGAYNPFIYFRF